MSLSSKDHPMPQTTPVRSDHHRFFSHCCVQELCAEDPIAFFDAIRTEPEELLDCLWSMTKMHEYDMDIPVHGIDTDGTQVRLCAIHGHPAAMFTMPTPMVVPEAHLIAVVLTGFQRVYRRRRRIPFRCFTLDKAPPAHGMLQTSLVERTQGVQSVLGPGPAPTVPAFIAAIERVLAGHPLDALCEGGLP